MTNCTGKTNELTILLLESPFNETAYIEDEIESLDGKKTVTGQSIVVKSFGDMGKLKLHESNVKGEFIRVFPVCKKCSYEFIESIPETSVVMRCDSMKLQHPNNRYTPRHLLTRVLHEIFERYFDDILSLDVTPNAHYDVFRPRFIKDTGVKGYILANYYMWLADNVQLELYEKIYGQNETIRKYYEKNNSIQSLLELRETTKMLLKEIDGKLNGVALDSISE